MTDYLAYAYALAVAAGGVVGYIKKGSLMSGIMVIDIHIDNQSKPCLIYLLSFPLSVMLFLFLGACLWWSDWIRGSSNVAKPI